MLALLSVFFLGLSVLLALVAIVFMLYVMVANPKEFFGNLLNPLWLVYFLPSAACFWIAEWLKSREKGKEN